MATQVVCSVYDSAVDAYMQPMFAPAMGAIVRSFGDEVQREGSPMRAHPDDYRLMYLGTFDDHTGRFSSTEDEPRCLVRGKDVARVDQ